MFDFSEMNVEQLEARMVELTDETSEEKRDALDNDALEARINEMEAIHAELNARKQAHAEEEQRAKEVAQMQGKPIIETEDRNMYDINTAEYRDLWLRNLQGNLTDEEKRAYSSSTTNAVPTMVSDKFFEKLVKLAPMLSEITLLRVAGNIKFVSEGTRNSADAGHTENSANDPSADTTVSVSLGGYEFLKILQISRTAKLMSIDAFEGWLVNMLTGDIARSIDNYIINNGTNGFVTKVTWTTDVNQVVNTQGYTYGNICDLIAMLPAAYDPEAKFLVNKKTLYADIATIVNSSGDPIFVPDTVNGLGGRLMGYPVLVDDYVSTANKALYLGKWTDIVGNLSEDIHVDSDESAGFTANAIMYRGVAVFDSQPAKTDAFVRLVSTT